jgi:integrase
MGTKTDKESKRTRRGNGEGSIFQRKDDRWCAKIQIGTSESGLPIIKTFYGKERKDVVTKLKDYHLLVSQGLNSLATVALKEYITSWFKLTKINELKPSSLDRLESIINNHIIPKIGHYGLTTLTAPIIQEELINKMTDNNLSYSSIKKAYDAINACMKYAVDNRQLIFNPVKTVSKPSITKFKKKKIEIFTDDEKSKFEEICLLKYKNNKFIYKIGYGFILMLYTGIRMGEALALKWSDVDIENKKIHINNSVIIAKNRKRKNESDPKNILINQDTTKTPKGNRTIPLNKKALNNLVQLNEMNHYTDNSYIFFTKNNTPIRPRNLQNTFDSILGKADIGHKGIHILRHTFASMLFKKGVDVKTVSELLGHADVRITYMTYIHLIQEQKNQAIDLLDD